jgi:hypothetical protein
MAVEVGGKGRVTPWKRSKQFGTSSLHVRLIIVQLVSLWPGGLTDEENVPQRAPLLSLCPART